VTKRTALSSHIECSNCMTTPRESGVQSEILLQSMTKDILKSMSRTTEVRRSLLRFKPGLTSENQSREQSRLLRRSSKNHFALSKQSKLWMQPTILWMLNTRIWLLRNHSIPRSGSRVTSVHSTCSTTLMSSIAQSSTTLSTSGVKTWLIFSSQDRAWLDLIRKVSSTSMKSDMTTGLSSSKSWPSLYTMSLSSRPSG